MLWFFSHCCVVSLFKCSFFCVSPTTTRAVYFQVIAASFWNTSDFLLDIWIKPPSSRILPHEERWGMDCRNNLASFPRSRSSSRFTSPSSGWTLRGRPPFCTGCSSTSLWTRFQPKVSMRRRWRFLSAATGLRPSTSGTSAVRRSSAPCGSRTRDARTASFSWWTLWTRSAWRRPKRSSIKSPRPPKTRGCLCSWSPTNRTWDTRWDWTNWRSCWRWKSWARRLRGTCSRPVPSSETDSGTASIDSTTWSRKGERCFGSRRKRDNSFVPRRTCLLFYVKET